MKSIYYLLKSIFVELRKQYLLRKLHNSNEYQKFEHELNEML